MAGRRFPTFTFFPKATFRPTQKIRTEPTQERLSIRDSSKNEAMREAKRVIPPWYIPKGTAEKVTPIPKVEAKTITMTKSRIALEKSIV